MFGRKSAVPLRVVVPMLAVALAAFVLAGCSSSSKEATQAPAAATSAAPAAATSAPAAAPSRIYILADNVIGSKGMTAEEKPLRSCTEVSRIAPGEELGWRIKVLDAATGDELKDTDVASVQIKLADGQVLDAKYGSHGNPPTDSFWSNFWVIPDDYPTGVLAYTIVATTTDGRTAEYRSDEFNIASSQLIVQAKQ
jgi:hypothetical protein